MIKRETCAAVLATDWLLEVARAALEVRIIINFKEVYIMFHDKIKSLFSSSIQSVAFRISDFAVHPDKNFTCRKKFPADKLLTFLVAEGSSSTKNELLDFFDMDTDKPTDSAFNQQRAKLKPEDLEAVFHNFNESMDSLSVPKDWLEAFDIDVDVTLVRSHSSKIKIENSYRRFVDKVTSFDFIEYGSKDTYCITLRIVRFSIGDGVYECIVTNLSRDEFPPERIRKLYFSRWGVETSFRKLKYTVGLSNSSAR